MTKFNNQELISNYPNCTCINPKLNSNKPILCFKSGMHQTEAEKKKKQIAITRKAITQISIKQKGITQIDITRKGITRKDITQIGITQIDITQKA